MTPDAVSPADIDETPAKGELPIPYARRIAAAKAAAVERARRAGPGRRHRGRRGPAHPAQDRGRGQKARASLGLLSGRRHRVHSAVTLVDAEGRARHRLSTSIVAFKRLSAEELDAYLAAGEWRGKAGGYAIQGRAEALVRMVSGSWSGIVGLPLFETRALLRSAGYPLG